MRFLSRAVLLGTLSVLAIAPSAMATPSLTAKVSPNKAGTAVQGNPIKFALTGTFPDTPSTTDGNVQLQSIETKLPPNLIFNTIPFSMCPAGFLTGATCPSKTKLGTAVVTADAGSAGIITVNTTLYFGAGFSVYANISATQPAVLNPHVAASLRSSNTTGYGLELYIPIPPELRQPIPGSPIYPTVQKVVATVDPAVASVKVKGVKGKVKVPLTGLGPCSSSKKEPFQMSINYSDAAGLNTVKTDSASATGTCKS